MKKIAKTKIVATIGPSSWSKEILKDMFDEGMRIARINASFAEEKEIKEVSQRIRSISPRIALLLDTQGTKVRVMGLENEVPIKGSVSLSSFNTNVPNTITVSYPNLHLDITRNTTILLDDGTIELKVSNIKDSEIICDVIQEGVLKPNKTVNIPSINLKFPTLTEKDKNDIRYAVENNFDFLAISFVRNAQDIQNVKTLIEGSNIKIISKIENQEGLNNFDEILQISDGIMIARGDLGVETPLEEIPILQKQMIYKCRASGKPVITATQMLESMRSNIKPTRAEVSDVANSVLDGTDALMLSAETSTGKNPVQVISMMNKIAYTSEKVMQSNIIYGKPVSTPEVDEISKSTCTLAQSIPLKGIVVISDSESTVASIARHRPNVPIWSISTSIERIRHDTILNGVKTCFIHELPKDRDESMVKAIQVIYTNGELDLTDKIAMISGSSIEQARGDTILEIVTIKDVLNL